MDSISLYPRSELLQASKLYPDLLFQVQEPPKKLHIIGSVEVLGQPTIAIVGARKATPYGLACANRFAKQAASQGLVVVSGGAIGCDQAAHRGVLEVGGKTVVILGCGADVVYPKKAKDLYLEVLVSGGALVSEAPWGTPVSKWGFSKRNRIIAALASATLIVEAGLPSGTFQTADATLALGNELLAVPGSIFSKESRGSNQLILQGAIPIVDDQSFNDALDLIFEPYQTRMSFDTSNSNDPCSESLPVANPLAKTISALQAQPMLPDQLVGVGNQSLIEVIRQLSKLEMEGLVERSRDGRYFAKA